MTHHDRLRLILHGAIVLLAGLLCGIPTVVESLNESARVWHTAHEALIMLGIWLLAESSVLSALVLDPRQATALLWALLAAGYGFLIGLVTGGIIGVSPFSPGDTPAAMLAFVAATIGIFGAVSAALLTLIGARAALTNARGT